MVVLNIILAVVMVFCCLMAWQLCTTPKGDSFDWGRGVSSNTWISAILAGIMVGAINYFAPGSSAPGAIIFLLLMIAMSVVLMMWWSNPEHGGVEWRELALFVVISFMIFMVSNTAAAAVVDTIGWTWAGVIMKIPLIMFIFTIGFMIANRYYYLASLKGGDQNDH